MSFFLLGPRELCLGSAIPASSSIFGFLPPYSGFACLLLQNGGFLGVVGCVCVNACVYLRGAAGFLCPGHLQLVRGGKTSTECLFSAAIRGDGKLAVIWPPRRKASENGLEQVGPPFPSYLRRLSLPLPPYKHKAPQRHYAGPGKVHPCASGKSLWASTQSSRRGPGVMRRWSWGPNRPTLRLGVPTDSLFPGGAEALRLERAGVPGRK